MASGVYTTFMTEIMKKTVDLINDDVVCILLDNSHTFSAANTLYTDVSANELAAAGGYTQKDKSLTTPAVVAGAFDADNVAWTSATFSAYHAVLFDETVTSPADMLICSIDFGGVQTVTAGTFTITWDGAGIIVIS